MKKKIKLRDMTKEQWDANRNSLCKFKTMQSCDECIFKWVNCLKSSYKELWIYHKDLYSDKFLDQEVEIEIPDILDKEEKEYLSFVIKPFKKITLKEFWNSKEKLAIHCDTEEKANKLLRAFNKIGKKWCDDDSYIGNNYWYDKRENTCYSNDNGYTSINWYKENDYKIYEFEDVDLGKLEK